MIGSIALVYATASLMVECDDTILDLCRNYFEICAITKCVTFKNFAKKLIWGRFACVTTYIAIYF